MLLPQPPKCLQIKEEGWNWMRYWAGVGYGGAEQATGQSPGGSRHHSAYALCTFPFDMIKKKSFKSSSNISLSNVILFMLPPPSII